MNLAPWLVDAVKMSMNEEKRAGVPKFGFCSNNEGDKTANRREKPHVQRVESKLGTLRAPDVPNFDLRCRTWA